jgi:hypothetical protein
MSQITENADLPGLGAKAAYTTEYNGKDVNEEKLNKFRVLRCAAK